MCPPRVFDADALHREKLVEGESTAVLIAPLETATGGVANGRWRCGGMSGLIMLRTVGSRIGSIP
jgi:hypothetical protein